VIDESVFVPPDVLLDTPPHPIPANVRARVEVIKTEESTKRLEAFIFFLTLVWVLTWGRATFKERIKRKWLPAFLRDRYLRLPEPDFFLWVNTGFLVASLSHGGSGPHV
jgi:hypothetical protein